MGNNPDKYISYYINDERAKEVIDENKDNFLYSIYRSYSDQNGYLTKQLFGRLLQIDDDNILNNIFDIFVNKPNRMTFSELKVFYTAFANENNIVKFNLYAFLFFGKKAKIEKSEYIKNLTPYVTNNNLLEIFLDKTLLNFITSTEDSSYFNYKRWIKTKNEILFVKSLFLRYFNLCCKKNESQFDNLKFFKKVLPSSTLYKENIKKLKKNNYNYVCDCLVDVKNNNNLDSPNNELNTMKFYFEKQTASNRKHLSFDDFKNMLLEINVNQKLINLLINFMKCYTMKDYIIFEDFKYLMSHLYDRVSYSDKKKFLFKIILMVANQKISIKASQLAKILNIENNDYNPNGTINESNFLELKDQILHEEVDKYIGYMDNFGLLPYIKFGIKPIEQKVKKKIIKFYLRGKTVQEYLEDNFDTNDLFYAINTNFWDTLIDPETEIEKEVNNIKIAEEDNILNITEDDLINENNTEENKDKENKDNKKEKEKENKNENIENNKKENENKEKVDKSEENEENNIENKLKNKRTKHGKLKKEIEYEKDFIILCDDLFDFIRENFIFDYIIELPKSQRILPLIISENNDQSTSTENTTISSSINNNNDNKNNIPKLEINISKGFIKKEITLKNNILEYIVDFYPVETLEISFKPIINFLQDKKERLDAEKEKEEYEKMTKEEKIKIDKEKELAKKQRSKREQQFHEEKSELDSLYMENKIDKNFYNEKINLIQEKYSDLFSVPSDDFSTKLKLSQLLDLFQKYQKQILFQKLKSIKKEPRSRTNNEIIIKLIKNNEKILSDGNFETRYFVFEKNGRRNLLPEKKQNFYDLNIDGFVFIVIDIFNENGISHFSILSKNEFCENNDNDNDNNISNKSKIDDKIISNEEKKRIENENILKEKNKKLQEKLEREKQEKLIKEQEKKSEEKEEKISPPYGLPNFGNTCYFNSINQIMLNLPILKKLFKIPNIKYLINKQNKFGYRGKFILNFMSLYLLYPSKINNYILNFKNVVGSLKDTFNNREQQDAHEYLNFILEALHEELNLKSSKRYIEDKDFNFRYNTENELGNIAWANNLRRNVSFIDSIFMFQLKSNMVCRKCNTKKINFETGYVFDLPLSLCKMVYVEVNLNRLPFKYKVYYKNNSDKFKEYLNLEENKNKNISEILWNYYTEKLSFDERKEHTMKLHFKFDFEREKKIKDIIDKLRNLSILNLEKDNFEININNKELTEYKIKNYTDFVAYSTDKRKIISQDTIIDKFVDSNDRIFLDIYEVLNTNGLSLLLNKNKNTETNNNENNKKVNIFSYQLKNIKTTNKFEELKSKIKSTNYSNNGETNKNMLNILSFNDKLTYYPDEIINYNVNSKNKSQIITEFLIPIIHHKRAIENGNASIFLDYYYILSIGFPQEYLILNNTNNNILSTKDLYDYIYNLNTLYMTHPNKKTDNFWWNIDPNANVNIKKCYPFVLRFIKRNKKYINKFHCAKCQWYNFCPGCIVYPDDKSFLNIKSDFIILVDWCNSFLSEEIENCNFISNEISDEKIKECLESMTSINDDKNYQSIKDCFDLFFAKELLDDPLSCRNCGGPQNFTKNYEINKLPYVLILSLKRFKYNENSNFKLRQLITYPLYDLEIKNKKYDLFGVVNHYGGINSGHYTSIIKYEDKWVMCDDNRISQIAENKVMNSSAYILFYISKDSIYNNSYFKTMKSVLDHITINQEKKTLEINDENFFEGEPVYTDYGEGYVIEDCIEDFDEKKKEESQKTETTSEGEDKEKNIFVKVKFDFGKGMVNKKNVKKQILKNSETK